MAHKLSISGFKCINREELELKPLTILTGINASGKSSVIQALLLLMRFAIPANRFSLEKVTAPYSSVRTVRNKITNQDPNITLELDERSLVSALELSALTPINESDIRFKGTIVASVELQKMIDSGQYSRDDIPTAYIYENADGVFFNNPEVFYLNANRIGPQDSTNTNEAMKVGPTGEFIYGHFHKIKDEPLHKELVYFTESKTLAYQVGRWISYITDVDSEIRTTAAGPNQANITYHFKDIGEVLPSNLGAGVSYVAKIVIMCLMAKKSDIVIIENPEIHLHPKAQSLLGHFFCFIAKAGIDLIIETHCEHLINRVRLEVSNEFIKNDDVVIYYKSSTKEPFKTLQLDINGHFVDQNEDRQSFPKGFFDASVDTLLSLR
jgi:predicted ATPase